MILVSWADILWPLPHRQYHDVLCWLEKLIKNVRNIRIINKMMYLNMLYLNKTKQNDVFKQNKIHVFKHVAHRV
jgi:hypothetical protein